MKAISKYLSTLLLAILLPMFAFADDSTQTTIEMKLAPDAELLTAPANSGLIRDIITQSFNPPVSTFNFMYTLASNDASATKKNEGLSKKQLYDIVQTLTPIHRISMITSYTLWGVNALLGIMLNSQLNNAISMNGGVYDPLIRPQSYEDLIAWHAPIGATAYIVTGLSIAFAWTRFIFKANSGMPINTTHLVAAIISTTLYLGCIFYTAFVYSNPANKISADFPTYVGIHGALQVGTFASMSVNLFSILF